MKKCISTILKVIAFFALWIAGITIWSLYALDKPLFLRNNPATLRLWYELVPMIVTLLINFIFIKVIDKGKIKISIFGNILRDSIWGVVLGCMWIGITFFIITAIGSFHIVSKNAVAHIWIWVVAILLNVIMQEFFVRGYVFQLIKEKSNNIIAIIVTTAIFTAMHGGAFEAGLVSVLNVITMSVSVSVLLIYTKNLLAPIIVHFIWNVVGSIFLGGVSLASDYPKIWDSTFSGNAKMEGSIVVLAIIYR